MQTTSTNRVKVEPAGAGVVAHVGLHALGAFADRLGLPALLSSRIVPRGERLPAHDRGKVLTQMALVIAGGGESCADIEHLRLQSDLFGHVASDSTVHRAFHELDAEALGELAAATAAVRAKVWDRKGLTMSTEPVILDIDASLIEVHSENKVGAAPNYKSGYGFHPMLCFADATGEALAALCVPATPPPTLSTTTSWSSTPRLINCPARSRPDTALVTTSQRARGWWSCEPTRRVAPRASWLRAGRGRVGFFVTAGPMPGVNAVFDAVGVDRRLAPRCSPLDGELREDAAVAELTCLIENQHLPEGTRLIVRREPLHPGAQRSLIPDLDYRYWGFWTDQEATRANLTPRCAHTPTWRTTSNA